MVYNNYLIAHIITTSFRLLNSQIHGFHGMIRTIVLQGVSSPWQIKKKHGYAVDIYGQTYKMVGTETSSHMRQVASIVDDKMREISSHNPNLDSTKIAVLAAVNSVHDYLKLKEQVEQMEVQLKKLKG